MKKLSILTTSLLVFSWLSLANAVDLSNCKPTTFNATAYYSPIEGQKYYVRWNLQDEYILQWKWIKWASWKPVFEWMIAAPKNYDFWTQLYFEWYWMAEISDRGGAIVSVPDWNDRIDIWMWKWEEGLRRALTFGRKTINAYICPAWTSQIDFDIDKFPSVEQLVNLIPSNQVKQKIASLFETYLDIKNQSEKWLVQQLEEILSKKWLLDKKLVDWKYDYYTSQAICIYQLYNKLLTSSTDSACWSFWPKTSAFLKSDEKTYNLATLTRLRLEVKKEFLKRARQTPLDLTNQMWSNLQKIDTTKLTTSSSSNISSQKNSSSSSSISSNSSSQLFSTYMDTENFDKSLTLQLQQTLKKIWYFNVEPTGFFWTQTKDSICKFQLDKKILGEKSDPLCGIWGPTTRKAVANQIASL